SQRLGQWKTEMEFLIKKMKEEGGRKISTTPNPARKRGFPPGVVPSPSVNPLATFGSLNQITL
ncbi:MAG: hypothetical protein ACXIU2_07950, partial [Cyclobacteriaceae bacterium]